MRRLFLRGGENVLKRQLIHVGAFNLSLIFRLKLGAGTPRGLSNRPHNVVFIILSFQFAHETVSVVTADVPGAFRRRVGVISRLCDRNCRHRFSRGSATGC